LWDIRGHQIHDADLAKALRKRLQRVVRRHVFVRDAPATSIDPLAKAVAKLRELAGSEGETMIHVHLPGLGIRDKSRKK
jgi:hypothetical protein